MIFQVLPVTRPFCHGGGQSCSIPTVCRFYIVLGFYKENILDEATLRQKIIKK
jgi:hypothetical protein